MSVHLIESHALVQKLFALLQSLDASRAAHREQLEQLKQKMQELLQRWEDREPAPGLRQRMSALVAALETHLPRLRESGRERWQSFRQRIQQPYEAAVEALRAHRFRVPSLRPRNIRRSVFHVLSGVTCLLLIQHLMPRWQWAVVPSACALIAWSLEIARRRWPAVNQKLMAALGGIAHVHEAARINSSTWYVTALAVLGLCASPLAASLALIVLAVADPVAGEIGRRFGKIKINAGRTLEGSLAFLVSGCVAAWLVTLLYFPELAFTMRLAVCLAGASAGAVAEALSTRVDDNFLVPLATAAGVSLCGLF